jgi:hypothetical protein
VEERTAWKEEWNRWTLDGVSVNGAQGDGELIKRKDGGLSTALQRRIFAAACTADVQRFGTEMSGMEGLKRGK